MNHLKRVHIDKHFVLVFSVDEEKKTATFEDYIMIITIIFTNFLFLLTPPVPRWIMYKNFSPPFHPTFIPLSPHFSPSFSPHNFSTISPQFLHSFIRNFLRTHLRIFLLIVLRILFLTFTRDFTQFFTRVFTKLFIRSSPKFSPNPFFSFHFHADSASFNSLITAFISSPKSWYILPRPPRASKGV